MVAREFGPRKRRAISQARNTIILMWHLRRGIETVRSENET